MTNPPAMEPSMRLAILPPDHAPPWLDPATLSLVEEELRGFGVATFLATQDELQLTTFDGLLFLASASALSIGIASDVRARTIILGRADSLCADCDAAGVLGGIAADDWGSGGTDAARRCDLAILRLHLGYFSGRPLEARSARAHALLDEYQRPMFVHLASCLGALRHDRQGSLETRLDAEIAAARALAPPDKQPFDLAIIDSLVDPDGVIARYSTPDQRARTYAHRYYVAAAHMRTLAELAHELYAANENG